LTPRRSSLRLRLTVLATLAIAVTAALATAILVFTLATSVRANVTTTLNAYAASIARTTTKSDWPGSLPAATDDPSTWAQVVDASGTVVAATTNVNARPALYSLPAGSTTPQPTAAGSGRGEERVVAQRYVIGATPVVIYAGSSTRLLSILADDIQGNLLYALPPVLIGAVAISWFLIGRTLRPVERMRAEAAEITGSDLDRRIPEPAGHDEIGRLARTLNTMLARLEDSAARQRLFVADASHELRNPLAAVRTSLEVGLAHPDHAPWPELAGRAAAETARMQHLVDALLLLARADAGALDRHREPLDLATVARTAVDAAPARIPVEVKTAEEVRVLGDADQLTRLIRNLLDNADRHAATAVRLTVTTEAGDAVIQVTDDGPGIRPADRDRVFDRFVRLETARTHHTGDTTGTGLGLAIARDITTAHEGTITITDPQTGSHGTTFTVRLPTLRTTTSEPDA
jgi:signal transduction histidine kinase